MTKIIYSKQAIKFIKRLPKNHANRILTAISLLPLGDVEKLKGYNGFRLRIGDYRVIFTHTPTNGNLHIIDIDNRGDIYKNI
ncbi:type II toxin-antitoxin system RelE family toxin [Globicatella sanguinis]